jgi:lambda family phage minor tail protein L
MVNSLISENSFYYFCLYNPNDPNFGRFYFCGHDNVVYGGVAYKALPLELRDLSYSTNQDSSPTITVGDADGYLGRLISTYGGLEGCLLSIGKVKRAWLDDGTSPNFNVRTNPEVYTITKLLSRLPNQLSYKLKNQVVATSAQIPGRTLQATCTWKVYRGAGCGYTGGYFDENNNPTTDPKKDVCALTDAACKVRGNYANFSGVITIGFL